MEGPSMEIYFSRSLGVSLSGQTKPDRARAGDSSQFEAPSEHDLTLSLRKIRKLGPSKLLSHRGLPRRPLNTTTQVIGVTRKDRNIVPALPFVDVGAEEG